MEDEIWKWVPGLEDKYDVSNKGRVRCYLPARHKLPIPRLLKQYMGLGDYWAVVISRNKVKRFHYVHRLVAQTFLPNPLKKPTVNHIDGEKTNNDLSNLEWASFRENNLHAYRIGLKKGFCKPGQVPHNRKLTPENAAEIRRQFKKGEITYKHLADEYGVAVGAIAQVVKNITFKNAPH